MYTKYIDLIVDGDVVDLNRIALPEDTPIIDQRSKDSANQRPIGNGRSGPKDGILRFSERR